jgi:hypothetical protein
MRYDWGTSAMIEKLAYAAVFHNIALSGNSKLIKTITQSEFNELDEEEKILINRHASYAAHTLKAMEFTPDQVCEIVKEQHGCRTGSTFPEIKTHSSKLTTLFRIVSELATQLIKSYEDDRIEIDVKEILLSEFKRNGNTNKEIFQVIQDCLPESIKKPQ